MQAFSGDGRLDSEPTHLGHAERPEAMVEDLSFWKEVRVAVPYSAYNGFRVDGINFLLGIAPSI